MHTSIHSLCPPNTEWEYVYNPDLAKDYPGSKYRRPEPLASYCDKPESLKAGLDKIEVLALRLFTGPMYMKVSFDQALCCT